MSEEESTIVGAMIAITCIILMVISFASPDLSVKIGCIIGQVLLIGMGVSIIVADVYS